MCNGNMLFFCTWYKPVMNFVLSLYCVFGRGFKALLKEEVREEPHRLVITRQWKQVQETSCHGNMMLAHLFFILELYASTFVTLTAHAYLVTMPSSAAYMHRLQHQVTLMKLCAVVLWTIATHMQIKTTWPTFMMSQYHGNKMHGMNIMKCTYTTFLIKESWVIEVFLTPHPLSNSW